jgi:hypothetical protein
MTLNDQTLIALEKVKLASGDINSVYLSVEFDSVWDNFINRTASFHTSNDLTPHEVLMIDNQCLIPPSVLEKPGTLYVGVVGVSADGSATKTSSEAGFKIVKGAAYSHSTLTPELDLYCQYLKAINDKTAPLTQKFLAEADEALEEVRNKAEEIKEEVWAALSPTLLWENPSPTEEFAAQTVSLDTAGYKRFILIVKSSTSDDHFWEHTISEKNLNTNIHVEDLSNGSRIDTRMVLISDTQMVVSKYTEDTEFRNRYCIPYKLYGFKY